MGYPSKALTSEILLTNANAPALGTRYKVGGKEYIFLKAPSSGVVGNWVTFDEAFIATKLAANAKGQVAVLMGTTTDNTYGVWAQIFGPASGFNGANCADNADLYATATAGLADDAVVVGDRIKGAWARALIGGSNAVGAVQLAYPFVDDIAD